MTASTAVAPYVPRDHLFLWWLAEPERPQLIGELSMVRSLRGVSLRNCEDWTQRGFALSEDRPFLRDQRAEFVV
jgi:serine/threonine-protein kinase HipA